MSTVWCKREERGEKGRCCDTGHGRFVGRGAESGGQWCNEGQIEKEPPGALICPRGRSPRFARLSCVSIFFKWTALRPKAPPMKNDTSNERLEKERERSE